MNNDLTDSATLLASLTDEDSATLQRNKCGARKGVGMVWVYHCGDGRGKDGEESKVARQDKRDCEEGKLSQGRVLVFVQTLQNLFLNSV